MREEEEVLGRYRFEHALVEPYAAIELGSTRRRGCTTGSRRLLEERPDTPPGELAYHWTEAGVYGEAIRASRRAGQHALEALAPDGGRALVRHGARAAPTGVTRTRGLECDLLDGTR